ncbi:hypothetical protein GBF38_019677 [Nibea albiflora]|uniref:Uncharacterized protein n=1 Tax=Nibea albiflora TaxID=240163 RepID=A0ACB7F382_NIBAL|nr:hypothetical protein GBF38_019677 [Nibea albiflora]
MCHDRAARGGGVPSRVIRSESTQRSRREVLTFPIKALEKDKPVLTATRGWGPPRGASNHLAAGDEAATPGECGSFSLGFHCAFSP